VSAQQPVEGGEFQHFGRGELEPNGLQLLAEMCFEVMAAIEDPPHARGQDRLAPPIKLDLSRTPVTGDAGAEVVAWQLRGRCDGAFDCIVEPDADRFGRQVYLVVVHGRIPRCS
jgi:hypothetical protein